ncbi:hypothetical protein KC349_g96 [Hortaea werneckii]|nr:hypothetical protein KC349_g96 [Hortaea werneckii]
MVALRRVVVTIARSAAELVVVRASPMLVRVGVALSRRDSCELPFSCRIDTPHASKPNNDHALVPGQRSTAVLLTRNGRDSCSGRTCPAAGKW